MTAGSCRRDADGSASSRSTCSFAASISLREKPSSSIICSGASPRTSCSNSLQSSSRLNCDRPCSFQAALPCCPPLSPREPITDVHEPRTIKLLTHGGLVRSRPSTHTGPRSQKELEAPVVTIPCVGVPCSLVPVDTEGLGEPPSGGVPPSRDTHRSLRAMRRHSGNLGLPSGRNSERQRRCKRRRCPTYAAVSLRGDTSSPDRAAFCAATLTKPSARLASPRDSRPRSTDPCTGSFSGSSGFRGRRSGSAATRSYRVLPQAAQTATPKAHTPMWG